MSPAIRESGGTNENEHVIGCGMNLNFQSESQNIFFRCVEDCNEAIMISNARGVLSYVNPAWEKIYGFTREEAVGQTPALLHSGHHTESFYREMWDRILDPEVGHWKGELINRAKDGSLVPVLLTITPFRSPEGSIIGFMGIALDMTHKKELEAKIVHQDRLASIGLLASGLAHEIGTPLGVIRGRAEFLMMSHTEDTPLNKGLQVIISQIDRISKLMRSLLSVSRSFSDVRVVDICISEVFKEVLSLVGQNLKQDSVQIRNEIPEGLLAQADFGRLEQIVLNLVMNSIHAIRKAIQDGRTNGHYMIFSATVRKSKIAIDITDSGCGIASENMKKLFRPFFTTKQVGEGTGLGLAIVAQLVREIGGEISVQSTPGEGTTFTLLLNAVHDETLSSN